MGINLAYQLISQRRSHVVLVTKFRRDAITDRVRELLETTTREVCARHGTTVTAFDGEDDHIHLLLGYPPKNPVSTLVRHHAGGPQAGVARSHPIPVGRPLLVTVLLCGLHRRCRAGRGPPVETRMNLL